MTRWFAFGAAGAVAAMLGGSLYFALGGGSPSGCGGSQAAGGFASIGGPFELVGPGGAVVSDEDVITEPALVYFGYTFCPDICPVDLGRNAAAVDLLEKRGVDATPVFITVDPERDTPEAMAEYAGLFHPKMIGLSGSLEQVDAAAKAYRVYYRKHEADGEHYLVDHSVFTYLVLPGSGTIDYFGRSDSAEAVRNRVACHLRGSEAA